MRATPARYLSFSRPSPIKARCCQLAVGGPFHPIAGLFVFSSLSFLLSLLLDMDPSAAMNRAYLEQMILAQQNPSFPTFCSPYDLSDDFVPLYGCRHRASEPCLSTWTAPPPSYDDLMVRSQTYITLRADS